ncbi:MAG TPA: acetate--CoA ligase family protein, partial [Candidatus Limnocylindrales bacterium]
AFAASGAYDVLAIVHDFPYRSLASEVETAREVTAQLLAATRDRPEILPVYISLTSGEPPPETKRQLDDAGGVPLLRGALEAFTAIAAAARWEAAKARRQERGPLRAGWPALAADRTPWGHDAGEPLPGGGRTVHSERESLAILAAAGISVTTAVAVADADAALVAARQLERPVALKLDAAGLAHKSEAGGVRVGVQGDEAVRAAAAELLDVGAELARSGVVRVSGLLVEPMAGPGVELIIGMKRDPQFGPLVLVGLGGILAEVLDDVSLRLAPIDAADAAGMLDELRASPALDGVRGQAPVDRDPVVDILVRLGRLATERPDIVEVDLNPVIAGPTGAVAVDALVVSTAT